MKTGIHHKYKRGEKQMLILDFVKSSGNEGRRYIDIVKFAFELSWGRGSFDPIENRGYYAGVFKSGRKIGWFSDTSQGWGFECMDKGDGKFGKWTINSYGMEKLEKQKGYFLKRK